MRVEVDRDRCEGNAVCVGIAPDLFDLDDEDYAAQTVDFLKASIRGWVYARDNAEEAATIVTEAGSTLGKSHQLWMVNETNKLIWPSPNGIGCTTVSSPCPALAQSSAVSVSSTPPAFSSSASIGR